MQKKPEGESRIPTDAWAGMGFSKSMPESAIRDKLGQLGINSARFDDHGALPPPAEYAEVSQLVLHRQRCVGWPTSWSGGGGGVTGDRCGGERENSCEVKSDQVWWNWWELTSGGGGGGGGGTCTVKSDLAK